MSKNKIIPTIGYNHLEVGSPGNTRTFRICGAHTKQEFSHELCQLPAGHGTSHIGVGRCKLHGGSLGMKENRYSKLWRGRMAEIARLSLEQEDTDPLDLLAELDVQRVILSVLLDRLNGMPGGSHSEDTSGMSAVRDYIENPPLSARALRRKSSKSSEQIENMDTVGDGGDVKITEQGYPVYLPTAEFSSSTLESPPSSAKAIDMELVEQIRQALNDVVNTVSRVVSMRNQTAITKSEVTYLLLLLKEGMNKFVPKENHEAYVRWLMDNIPGGKKVVGGSDEDAV